MVRLTLCTTLGAALAAFRRRAALPARLPGRSVALLAPLAFAPALHAAAMPGDAVLLSSTAPGYVPGVVITAGERLALPDGASATLLFRSGAMLRIRGPFEGALNAAEGRSEPDAAPGLAKGLQMQGVDAAVIGGTRAVSAPRLRTAPDTVRVDPQRSDTYCVKPDDFVWIRRPAEESGSYGLRRRGNMRALQWPVGVLRMPWPDDVLIEDNDRFEFIVDGAAKVTATFRVMENRPASDAAWVAEGILRGCRDQFDAALEQLGRAVVPPELWVTTDHGRAPVYRAGEAIQVTVQSNMDGYLYCVRAWLDKAVPVFPTPAMSDARVRGAVPVSIPGLHGGTEPQSGRAGTEQIRCWLTDRDVSADLPPGFMPAAAERRPDPLAADFDKAFAGLGGTHPAKASLTLRIE